MSDKLKHISIGLFAAAFSLTINAYAAEDVGFRDGMVYISGSASNPNSGVTISVVKLGEDKGNIENVCYIDQVMSDDNSKYEFLFSMKDAADGETLTGEYRAYIKCKNTQIAVKEFSYADYTAVLEQIISAKSDTEILNLFGNEKEEQSLTVLGLKMDLYKLLTEEQKADFAKSLFADGQIGSDAQSVVKKINTNLSVALINTKTAVNISYGLELLGSMYDDITYQSLSDEAHRSFITESISMAGNVSDVGSVIKEYKKSDALYKINIAGAGAADSLIRQSAEILGINASSEYTKWCGLSEKSLTGASVKLVTSLSKNRAKTTDLLLSAMGEAMKDDSSPGGGSGGSGGSGGKTTGGGSGYTVPSDTVITPQTPSFVDIDSALWAKDAIIKLCSQNIISGYGDNTFRPNNPITREELVKVLVKAFDIRGESGGMEFDDVDKNGWYYTYISAAYGSGIVNGTGNGKFGISENVTRQDIAVMLYRIIRSRGITLNEALRSGSFADSGEISSYAAESVNALYSAGILNGYEDMTFRPSGNVTRAEAVYMINSILQAK